MTSVVERSWSLTGRSLRFGALASTVVSALGFHRRDASLVRYLRVVRKSESSLVIDSRKPSTTSFGVAPSRGATAYTCTWESPGCEASTALMSPDTGIEPQADSTSAPHPTST